jgi:dipeptidyl aminopeptidase/acylaminoacyl peptidase
MVPKDLLGIREYGAKSVSPDGKMIAVEVTRWARRARRDSGEENEHGMELNHRIDLWVIDRDSASRTCLTSRVPIQLSQWAPIWSPDSKQLAFFSTEGEENAFLEIWDRATGHERRLTTVGVDTDAEIDRDHAAIYHQVLWLDDKNLLVVLLPRGLHAHFFDENSRSLALADAGFHAAVEGKVATPVVASSPPSSSRVSALPKARLAIINTTTDRSRTVAEIPAWESRLAKRIVVLSPDQRLAAVEAFLPPGSLDPDSQFTDREQYETRLGAVSLDAHDESKEVRWANGIQPALVHPEQLEISWQPGSAHFAVLCQQPGPNQPWYVAEVDANTGKWKSDPLLDDRHLSTNGREVSLRGVAWLKEGRVAVGEIVRTPDGEMDKKWWAVEGDHASPLGSEEELVNSSLSPGPRSKLKLQTSDTDRLYEIDAAGQERTLFPDLNPQLKEIEEPRSIRFDYTSKDGKKLKANLLLPYGYKAGMRYPTVAFVYGGAPDPLPRRDDNSMLNLMLLAGRGYAVLLPDIPLSPTGVPGDPILDMNNGVDPAVDRAINLGIADPDRLAVMGHSYGGYSTFGLLTQTHRYRAGIGMMGLSDLPSLNLEFDPRFRYDDPNYAASVGPFSTESWQERMGVPLLGDPARYLRNSPVFAADRITTPLLIVSGDLDAFGTQAESMFTALNRQGKRAEFVRYLGEAHSLNSPANVLDLWQRIFNWLDTYVRNPTAGTSR